MPDLDTNARRMALCFAHLREIGAGPAISTLKLLNLSFTHIKTLGLLFSEGRLTMKELAERLQITPPSVTILARRLVQIGLVQRTTHPQDHRVTLLSLTDEGRELYESLAESQIKRLALLLSALNAEEQEQFLGLLERAVRSFATAPRAGDAPPSGD